MPNLTRGHILFRRAFLASSYTKTTLAAELQVHSSTVSRILEGRHRPKPLLIESIEELTRGHVPVDTWDVPATQAEEKEFRRSRGLDRVGGQFFLPEMARPAAAYRAR